MKRLSIRWGPAIAPLLLFALLLPAPLRSEPPRPSCLVIKPAVLDFGSLNRTRCETGRRTITIETNSSLPGCAGPIQVRDLQLTNGPAGGFRVHGVPRLPFELAPGQKVTATVDYRPRKDGSHAGQLLVHDGLNAPGKVRFEGLARSESQVDHYTYLERPLVDILFVIDSSPAMAPHLANLKRNLESFINWAVRLQVDYHIGVISADISGRRHRPGCLRGAVRYVAEQTPDPRGAFLQNANLGAGGDPRVQPLEAMRLALTAPRSEDPSCHRGFHRPGAALNVIYVSASTDQSFLTQVRYRDFLRELRGFRNPDFLRASAVVAVPGWGCQERSFYDYTRPPATRLLTMVRDLRGVRARLCSTNWASTLSALGSIAFGYRTIMFLSRTAQPEGISVTVNGRPVKESPSAGWSYDSSANSVNFSKMATPPERAVVRVSYRVACSER